MRRVRAAAVHLQGWPAPSTYDEKVSRALERVDRAARDCPDAICLPEGFANWPPGDDPKVYREYSQTVPGPLTDVFAERARRYNCYIICPLLHRDGRRLYNSAVFLDRKGEVAGIYHKYVPTIWEMNCGVSPGTEIEPIKCDFGMAGAAICYDANFLNIPEEYARKGTEIIFWPSMYEGGRLLEVWAMVYGLRIVTATGTPMNHIIDIDGRIRAQSCEYNPTVSCDMNLDKRLLHIDSNHLLWDRLKEKYGGAVLIQTLRPEAYFILSTTKPGLHVDDVIRECGLEPLRVYLDRALGVRKRALKRK
ncbi:MAG TPA: carbon-nitrogen hydrolase family protein [Candidatus Brocadiia bacterium]|nr:carbon-nitrogen hydrolase family protein [Candidatus Brocadiia bacterium]